MLGGQSIFAAWKMRLPLRVPWMLHRPELDELGPLALGRRLCAQGQAALCL